jgi:hypothetical protein
MIKLMGQHPCPDCLVEKSQISSMGNKPDMKRQHNRARQDSEARQWDVNKMCSWIYQSGLRVDGTQVDKVLGPMSAVPNQVCLMVMAQMGLQ